MHVDWWQSEASQVSLQWFPDFLTILNFRAPYAHSLARSFSPALFFSPAHTHTHTDETTSYLRHRSNTTLSHGHEKGDKIITSVFAKNGANHKLKGAGWLACWPCLWEPLLPGKQCLNGPPHTNSTAVMRTDLESIILELSPVLLSLSHYCASSCHFKLKLWPAASLLLMFIWHDSDGEVHVSL